MQRTGVVWFNCWGPTHPPIAIIGTDPFEKRSAPKPLSAAMDNVLAWRLGEAVHATMRDTAGDLIDRGLSLLKHLRDTGFGVVELSDRRG